MNTICRYLDNNCIEVVEGLHTLTLLEELHVSNQRLSDDQRMIFDEASMRAIGVCSCAIVFFLFELTDISENCSNI
jgi:hypothetical protein